jgi:hypothetical protein
MKAALIQFLKIVKIKRQLSLKTVLIFKNSQLFLIISQNSRNCRTKSIELPFIAINFLMIWLFIAVIQLNYEL